MLSDLRVGRSEKVMEFGCYGLEIIGQGRYYLGKVKNVQKKVIYGNSLMHCIPLMLR